MAAIQISALCKNDGDVAVLRGVELDVADGEFVVLVGPSGCGKSALLAPSPASRAWAAAGSAVGGRLVNDLPPKDRDVAMVLQSYALYPHVESTRERGFRAEASRHAAARIDAPVESGRLET